MRVPRLYKVLAVGFLGYAVAAATPEQQSRIVDGALAVKDAALDACVREDGLCARGLQSLGSAVGGLLSDGPAPWMDEGQRPGSRVTVTPPPTAAVPSGAGRTGS